MPQLHVPMPYEPQDPPVDVESAWRAYTAAVYVKFLADEDFDAANEPELNEFKAMEGELSYPLSELFDFLTHL